MRRFYPLPDATSTGPSHWQSKWQSIHRLPSVPPRRIHARLKSNEADRVDQASAMLEEMQRLPSISQFSQRIAQEKAKLVSNDAAVQRKVDGVLKDFEDDLKNFFDPRGVEQIDKRVREARDNETADARPDAKEQAKQ